MDDWDLFVRAVGLIYIFKWMLVAGRWIIYREVEMFGWLVRSIKVEWTLFKLKLEEEKNKVR